MVDDDPIIRELYSTTLKSAGFFVSTTANTADAAKLLTERHYDGLLLDLFLYPNRSSLEDIEFFLGISPKTKIMILTANASIPTAVEAMRRGATGFFLKNQDLSKIIDGLQSLLIDTQPTSTKLESSNSYGIIGCSKAIHSVLSAIDKFKDVDSTVLITGESGTGKELVARALHTASHRSKEPFFAVNCGAIPENLLESELFGYRRGAFTDAKTDKKGIFELASSGTLLLDEIGELPLSLQVKLLRALQEKEVRPLGGDRAIPIDTRLIAATNRDLIEECEQGRFREDLFYRLSVLNLRIPPLRERPDDIPVLVEHFLGRFNAKFNRQVLLPKPDVMAHLKAYPWPGNIRELQNALERSVVLAQNQEIDLDTLFESNRESSHHADDNYLPLFSDTKYDKAHSSFEKKYLVGLLKSAQGNVCQASRVSGIHRPQLYRLIKRHSLDVENFKYEKTESSELRAN